METARTTRPNAARPLPPPTHHPTNTPHERASLAARHPQRVQWLGRGGDRHPPQRRASRNPPKHSAQRPLVIRPHGPQATTPSAPQHPSRHRQPAAGMELSEPGLLWTRPGLLRTKAGALHPGPGMEQTWAGLEQTNLGMEQTEVGKEQTDLGIEQTGLGLERPRPGALHPRPGTEQTRAGLEQTEPGIWSLDGGEGPWRGGRGVCISGPTWHGAGHRSALYRPLRSDRGRMICSRIARESSPHSTDTSTGIDGSTNAIDPWTLHKTSNANDPNPARNGRPP